MTTETRACEKCKSEFTIEPRDFEFYEQIKVPPPTWCPRCRLKRRMAWQGYKFLYKRKCDFSGDTVITSAPPNTPHKVYRQDIWWSDKWDPKSYGRDYDPSRSFFDQWRELQLAVPLPSLMTDYTTMVESDYCNAAATLKDCYLCFGFDTSEECAYCRISGQLKNCFDVSFAYGCELSYESLGLTKCFQMFYSQDCEESHDVWFSRDLVGCSDCVGCINLRNKSYHIFNKPYSREEYKAIFEKYDFGSAKSVADFRKKADEFMLTEPRKQFHGLKNQDVSGDYLYNCKGVKDSYMVQNAENVRYGHVLKHGGAYNSMDYFSFGGGAEWIYESSWVGIQTNSVKFSAWGYKNHDIEYCFGCMGSGDLFGCVGIRSGQYCILNKEYGKEQYYSLVAKIKEQMIKDSEYGQMLPAKYSPWPANETLLVELLPMTKEAARAEGFSWHDPDERDWKPASVELPEHIKDVGDGLLGEVLKCDGCSRNYQIIAKELAFLKRFNLPIPRKCPLCRGQARIELLNPIAIFKRKCAKCGKEIETSYAPDRPEIVYCESCYQNDVM